jgi:hypothetical protein
MVFIFENSQNSLLLSIWFFLVAETYFNSEKLESISCKFSVNPSQIARDPAI